jgi:NitT/TauT family transport system permease protein
MTELRSTHEPSTPSRLSPSSTDDRGLGSPFGSDGAPMAPRRPVRRAAMTVAPIVGLLVMFGVWEVYVRAAGIRPLILPPPSRILRHVAEEPAFYWKHARITIKEAALGFGIGFAAALFVATFIAHSRFLERATLPVIVLVQSTPVWLLAPVFVNWFGVNIWSKVLVAAVFCFIPFVINAFTGLRAIDENAHELMRSVSASRLEIFWRLRLPHSLPYLFSAARLCVGLSLVGAVIGEIFAGSTGGLGNTARSGQTRLLIDQLWGSIFALAFIGVVANIVLAAIEARVLRWHSSQNVER